MTGKEVEALLKAAEAVLKMAEDVGTLLGNLIDSLTPDDEETEFGPCIRQGCKGRGPIVTYKDKATGQLMRRIWCADCLTAGRMKE